MVQCFDERIMMVFQFPRLNKCCCCLPLRIGSLIIGYISIIFSMLSISAVSFSLYRVITYVEAHENEPNQEHTAEEITRIGQSLYITHAYLLLVYLYYFVISLLLIIGVHLNKTIYMKTYFNSGLFLLILALATVIVSAVFLHFFATVTLLKWCVIIFYCLIVVRSAYLELEEQNKPRDFEMQNLYITHRAPLLL